MPNDPPSGGSHRGDGNNRLKNMPPPQPKNAPKPKPLVAVKPPQQAPKQSGGNMSLNDQAKEALKTIEVDAKDAGWRLAGKQFIKMTREPLVAFLSKQAGDTQGIKEKIGAFFDTDLGEALLASMLSMGLSMIPETAGEIPRRLARELRIAAMTEVGDVVADLLMGPLRQVAVMYLQNIPATTRSEPAALPVQSEQPKVSVNDVLNASTKIPTQVPVPVGIGGNQDSKQG